MPKMSDEFVLVYFEEDHKTSVLAVSQLPIPASEAYVGRPPFKFLWGKKTFTAHIKATSSKFSRVPH